MTYTIPTYRIDKLLKRLEKFNKKAVKFHALPIIYTVTEPYDKEFTKQIWNSLLAVEEEIKYTIEMKDIDIDIESFKPIKGYQFLASIEHTENGNLLTKVSTEIELPERFRTTDDYCDHCKTHRFRKNIFIVYNEIEKTFVQVGSTCIKDYLGIDVALIAQRFEFLNELSAGSNDPDDHMYGSVWVVPKYNLTTFLATALNIMSIDGYVSGKTQWETEGAKKATGNETAYVIRGPYGKITEDERQWFRDRLACTDEHKAEADAIIEWILQQPTIEDYYYNLNVIAKNGWVKGKQANLAASMIIMYRIAMDKMVKKKEYAKSEYIGTVGEKIVVEATALKTYWCNAAYGTMYINNFVTDKGERIICYNSKELGEEGKKYRIKATVKKHQDYKETKQTVILRPKFEEI